MVNPTGSAAKTVPTADTDRNAPERPDMASAQAPRRLDHREALLDSIHDHLDGKRPYGSTQSMAEHVRNSIRQHLQPGELLENGNRKTGYARVTVQEDGQYSIALASGRSELRTMEEAELDQMIEFHLWQVEADAANLDHTASVAAPMTRETPESPMSERMASPPAPPPAPRAVAAHQDSNAYTEHYFDAQAIDLKVIDENVFQGRSHHIAKLSGQDYNCWWRSGILAGLLQHDPVAIGQLLHERLGDSFPAFEADVTKLCEIGQAARQGRLAKILTESNTNPPSPAARPPGMLKRPGLTDAEDNGEGEAVCKRIVRQLLLNAGETADDVDGAIDNIRHINGDDRLIKVLLKQFGCSYAMINRIACTDPGNESGLVTHGIQVYARKDSQLDASLVGPDGMTDAATLMMSLEADDVPLLVFERSHFNLAISKRMLASARDQDLAAAAGS